MGFFYHLFFIQAYIFGRLLGISALDLGQNQSTVLCVLPLSVYMTATIGPTLTTSLYQSLSLIFNTHEYFGSIWCAFNDLLPDFVVCDRNQQMKILH